LYLRDVKGKSNSGPSPNPNLTSGVVLAFTQRHHQGVQIGLKEKWNGDSSLSHCGEDTVWRAFEFPVRPEREGEKEGRKEGGRKGEKGGVIRGDKLVSNY